MDEGVKEQYPCKSHYFTVVGQSFVKMVADRHGHAAYHNKGLVTRIQESRRGALVMSFSVLSTSMTLKDAELPK